MMTQIEKVEKLMRENGEITQRDAYKIGVYRLGARIFDMKRAGTPIETIMRRVKNADGSYSHIAAYRLAEEVVTDA